MKVNLFCFALLLSASSSGLVGGQSVCINPNQRTGSCISIYDCESLLSVLARQPLAPIDRQFVSASECKGGYGFMPHVCCTSDRGYRRTTPGRELSSPSTFLFPAMPPPPPPSSSPSPPASLQPQQSSSSSSRRTVIQRKASRTVDPPITPACGGITIENKIYGGSNADLYEFPWMVLLEYARASGRRSNNCAGSLINQRYVLTAAHCVQGAIERTVGPLVSVRLGEHDLTRQVDCNQFGCATTAISVGIDEIIAHTGYTDASTNKQDDIALVRLDRNIKFSSSIQPICLPAGTRTGRQDILRAGTQLTVAGWGRTLKSARSAVKQKLVVPVVDQSECRKKFETRKVNIVESQLCAGSRFREDSCDGDSGGPLMRFSGSAWILEGIVSFGVRCGLDGWSAVHTRVASYDNWIRSHMKT